MSGASGLHFLTNDDFRLVEGSNGRPIMATGIPGLSLVLFYTTTCKHCETLKPIFSQLPSVIRGPNFAMVNISTNKGLIKKAEGTNTKIEYVPLVIFYVDGIPFSQYTGSHNLNEIVAFVKEMAARVQQKQQFAGPPPRTPVQQEMAPAGRGGQMRPMMQPGTAGLPQPMPSAVTRPGNGGNGFNGPAPGGMGGGVPAAPPGPSKAPIDEESRPYKPTLSCYVSWDDAYEAN